MQTSDRTCGRAVCVILVAMTLAPTAGANECETRTMRVTFYTCAEGFSHCLTHAGHQPIPFRTVAVGDPALLGRWLYIEDLGGWVLASDTGSALKKNSIDVFIGEGRMAVHARRLGVQFWLVRVCLPAAPAPRVVPAAQPAAPASPAPTRTASIAAPAN
jgi:3D (Asp-Asp-Asp) domain-containing protein